MDCSGSIEKGVVVRLFVSAEFARGVSDHSSLPFAQGNVAARTFLRP